MSVLRLYKGKEKKSPLAITNTNAQHKLSFIIIYHHPCLSSPCVPRFPAPTANKKKASHFSLLLVYYSLHLTECSRRRRRNFLAEFLLLYIIKLSRPRYTALSLLRSIETRQEESVDFYTPSWLPTIEHKPMEMNPRDSPGENQPGHESFARGACEVLRNEANTWAGAECGYSVDCVKGFCKLLTASSPSGGSVVAAMLWNGWLTNGGFIALARNVVIEC